ncbi:Sec1-like protein - like 4 [Theobroma cacao]|nr:Sec1-like protein - like 4 [Theobroma cacao]
MKNIEYGEGGIVYCLNQFRCFVSPAKNFNEAVYPVGILIQTPASPSFVNLYLIIWLFRRPMEEILKLLPGPHTETKRGRFASNPSFDTLQSASNGIDKIADGRRSLVLVVFVGGVTFAEISALRFLSAQEGMAYDLIIGTTKIVNGHTLAETFLGTSG